MSKSLQCYILSFVEIGLTVPEKKIFEGYCGHLGHVSSIVSSDLRFLVPESFHKNLVQIGTVVSEKIQFEFLYIHNPGPRSRNHLDLLYAHIFIYLIRYLLLLPFRSLPAINSEKSTVFTFSYRKA